MIAIKLFELIKKYISQYMSILAESLLSRLFGYCYAKIVTKLLPDILNSLFLLAEILYSSSSIPQIMTYSQAFYN